MAAPARSFSEFLDKCRPREVPLEKVLGAVGLRLKHVIDECPKRNVIFEVDSDASEEVLVKIVLKLCSTFSHIDVITHDDEYHFLVVDRLKRELKQLKSVASHAGTTEFRGAHPAEYRGAPNEYCVLVGTLRYFMNAELDRSVKREARENSVVVLYRTENVLDGRGLLEPATVDDAELQITPLLCHIYRMVDLASDEETERKMRGFIKRYSDQTTAGYVREHLGQLIRSAREARNLVLGADFDIVTNEAGGPNSIVLRSTLARAHPAMLQLLQLHHGLPVQQLRAPLLQRSPLHFLRTYERKMGVFRRGVYELKQWLPFLTQLVPPIYPSRLYPHDEPVTPILSIPPVATVSAWIVEMDRLVAARKKIPQRGARIIVCPSAAAVQQLWRYFRYSHQERVPNMPIYIIGSIDQLERTLYEWPNDSLITVLTTAAHFETWHTRYLGSLYEVTVMLGTPSSDLPSLHRAYRFARPVFNVITVPLDREGEGGGSLNDSGIESGGEEEQRMRMQALLQVQNRSHWANVFVKEMWGRGTRWRDPIVTEEDKRYEKMVEWMRGQWEKEGGGRGVRMQEEEWGQWRERKMREWSTSQ